MPFEPRNGGLRVLAIDGSPRGGGHTEAALRAVLGGLPPATRAVVTSLADGPDASLRHAAEADAFVLGSPMYRATYAAPLKAFLDRLPRGMWGETDAPVTGRAVAIVGTGASWHHFLGLEPLRSVLAGFFAAHVLPPGLYVPGEGFAPDGGLREPFAALAAQQGQALAELARALEHAPALAGLRPQA